MNFKINFSILFLAMFLFLGCKSIKINEFKKQLVTPGFRGGVTKIKYSTTLISSKEFKLESVKIEKLDHEISNVSIIQIPNGTLIDSNKNIKPGNYFIEFSVLENVIAKESVDTLIISILIDNKKIEFMKNTILVKDLLGK